MSVRVQFCRRWNGEIHDNWMDLKTISVPSGSTSGYTIDIPGYGQSDRIVGGDYGADCLMLCKYHADATRDNNNNIRFSGKLLDNYVFSYDSALWGSHIGQPVVVGNYDYYAVDGSGAEHFVYNYPGQSTVVANYTVPQSFTLSNVPSFTIPPQSSSNEVYYGRCHNNVNGLEVRIYLRFFNDYPKDYRPGAILGADSKWLSHNRSGGESHILGANGKYIEMRTVGGHSTNNNPPSIRINDKWTDQKKIGKE